jgi:anaerobic selenocysteine-containing dehydrogenase
VRIDLRPGDRLSTEELFSRMAATARFPLEEVRKYPHGKIFEVDERVQPAEPGSDTRLDVGNSWMLEDLGRVLAHDFAAEQGNEAYPYRLIPRRANNFINSTGIGLAKLHKGRAYNPAFMHPADLAALGLRSGDKVMLGSRHDRIPAIVEEDETLRRHVVAMHHGFGGLVDEDAKHEFQGSNVGRLMANDEEYDPITGIPRMGNVPVNVIPGWQ